MTCGGCSGAVTRVLKKNLPDVVPVIDMEVSQPSIQKNYVPSPEMYILLGERELTSPTLKTLACLVLLRPINSFMLTTFRNRIQFCRHRQCLLKLTWMHRICLQSSKRPAKKRRIRGLLTPKTNGRGEGGEGGSDYTTDQRFDSSLVSFLNHK